MVSSSCVYCAAAGTIFGTTDVHELGFSYLSISIFSHNLNCTYDSRVYCEKSYRFRKSKPYKNLFGIAGGDSKKGYSSVPNKRTCALILLGNLSKNLIK